MEFLLGQIVGDSNGNVVEFLNELLVYFLGIKYLKQFLVRQNNNAECRFTLRVIDK